MPLTSKGSEIMAHMRKQYGTKKGKEVFYATRNAGKITGVDRGFYQHMNTMSMRKRVIRTSVKGFSTEEGAV